MRLSAFTDILKGLSFEESLDALAGLGLGLIDLRSRIGQDNVDTLSGPAAEQVQAAVASRGLAVGCVASWGVNPMSGGYDPADPAHREAMRRRTAHLAELAERLGAANVRVYSFLRPPGQVSDAHRADNAAFLSELADIVGRRGRTLVIENEPPTLTATCAELGDLLRRGVPGNLKINWDIVNGWRAGETPWADGVFEHVAGHVAHVHVKGARADAGGRFAGMALPGRDDVPHEKIFRKLADSGFDGIVTIDPHYDQFAEADQMPGPPIAKHCDWGPPAASIHPVLEVLRRSKSFLEGILARLQEPKA